jgi:hypothetical protein
MAHHRRVYDPAEADDPGPPGTRRTRGQQPTPDEIFKQSDGDRAEVVDQLDFPIQRATMQAFHECGVRDMESGMQLYQVDPAINLREAIPTTSAARMSNLFRSAAFNDPLRSAARAFGFINSLCDAGTIKRMKLLHSVVASPASVPEPIPLESFVSAGYTWGDYKNLFRVTMTTLRADDEFEICAMTVCVIVHPELPPSVLVEHEYDG